MDLLLQLLVNGFINGSHYALLGVSFGLIFATTRIVHFAYGPVFTVAAYCGWFVSGAMGLPVVLGFAAAIGAAVVLGVLSYLVVYRPLELNNAPHLVPLIASLGLYIVIENMVGIVFGSGVRVVDDLSYEIFLVGPLFFTEIHVWQVASFVILGLALFAFLRHTRYGKAILAMTDNAEMARVIGIDTFRITILVFVIGSAISAVPAMLILLKDGGSTHMGFAAVFMGFVAVFIGGIGSLKGAAVGGFVLGLVESLGLWQIPTEWQNSIAFVVLFLMIMLRPQGLFGTNRT
ncbi:MAG: branched-chain amino acid ABC transporter permease [Alphaproteobacteria bacterium]|uniref:Branched-chain amino acid ABC transporter permease n=1 Tax=Futiania mangrovi TaxID=2959716 RepID=A0A9J6P7W0_9PROT|nr:branched-chain amino acid ABC transporter permease [Futiania mangrovii]MCP1335316.1 branched-chain amino acid ABC transporter permease [Futiania mangrovii]MDX5360016.1 branched-chain amino acid ABC transporter permease [Alphaproteobacteria bacterium]MDX5368104.1 branched-chain amino acid ABC transporter permease [Alphaproteobacteria bacterium]MDX5462943.1 branched-chain amino acid ABC transporter permease [Alphaproteobacteria bacterium]